MFCVSRNNIQLVTNLSGVDILIASLAYYLISKINQNCRERIFWLSIITMYIEMYKKILSRLIGVSCANNGIFGLGREFYIGRKISLKLGW